jgi:hypothetical protein
VNELVFTTDEVAEIVRVAELFERERIIEIIKNVVEEHQSRGITNIPHAVIINNIKSGE